MTTYFLRIAGAAFLMTASWVAWASPAAAAPEHAFVVRMQQLLQDPAMALSSTTPGSQLLSANNTLVSLATSTRQTIKAMEALIDASRCEVLLQIYEYDDRDEAAGRVFAALQRRVRRAVARRETLAVGIVVSRVWPSEHPLQQRDIEGLIDELRGAGGAAAGVTVELAHYRGTLLSILHTKTLIIDSTDALVMTGNLITYGGIDVDSRNMAAHLRGPVVATLRADWASAHRLSTPRAHVGPLASALGIQVLEVAPTSVRNVAHDSLHAMVLSRTSRWAPWSDREPNLQARGIVELLRAAMASIAVVNPSIGADAVRHALEEAMVERHVQVTAVLSRFMNADREHHLFGGNNAEQAFKLYTRLLARGGEAAADRLTVLWGSEDGRTIGVTRSAGNIHAKVTAIDDACLMVGSTNFNWLSFNTSREVTVALMGPSVTDGFRRGIFAQLVATGVPLSVRDVPQCQDGRSSHATCQYLLHRRR